MNKNEVKILAISSGEITKRSFIIEGLKLNFNVNLLPGKVFKDNYLDKIIRKLGLSWYFGSRARNIKKLNKEIKNKFYLYDILFIIKGDDVSPFTLAKIKSSIDPPLIIGWTADDIYLRHNRMPNLIKTAPFYDTFYTSKMINITNKELLKLGFKNPKFKRQGYDNSIHRKIIKNNSKFKKKIIFIGYGENDRYQQMNFLASNGIKVHIWGNGWKKFYKNKHENLVINKGELKGYEYSEALSNCFICLCFLRKLNRDKYTSRSFEIPACGGFMLAERTEEHLNYFRENIESAYFADKYELLEKVNFFIKNPDKRDEIARSGYKKCLESNLSYDVIAKEIIQENINLDDYN